MSELCYECGAGYGHFDSCPESRYHEGLVALAQACRDAISVAKFPLPARLSFGVGPHGLLVGLHVHVGDEEIGIGQGVRREDATRGGQATMVDQVSHVAHVVSWLLQSMARKLAEKALVVDVTRLAAGPR